MTFPPHGFDVHFHANVLGRHRTICSGCMEDHGDIALRRVDALCYALAVPRSPYYFLNWFLPGYDVHGVDNLPPHCQGSAYQQRVLPLTSDGIGCVRSMPPSTRFLAGRIRAFGSQGESRW
jgi:hypothetical protein